MALDAIGSTADDRGVEPKVVVGRNIRAQRKRCELTQEELAQRAGMHPVEVGACKPDDRGRGGRAERGTRDMRVSTVVKLAHGLDVPAMELMRGI